MTWVAGVDGCPAGWFRACRETASGDLHFAVFSKAGELTSADPRPEVVAIDMPIGLPEAGKRQCDTEVRHRIGPRRSSVFPVPIRPALPATSREQASAITEAIDGRRVAAQSFGLYPKIRELDTTLAADAALRSAAREAHPELSFWAWNGQLPMAHAKRQAAGQAERLQHVENWLGEGILAGARGCVRRRDLADDDILDAIAVLWTAHRIARGEAVSLPEAGVVDATGLPMEIVY